MLIHDDQLQDQLQRSLTTKVSVKRDARGAGSITIHFYSEEQLKTLYERLAGEQEW